MENARMECILRRAENFNHGCLAGGPGPILSGRHLLSVTLIGSEYISHRIWFGNKHTWLTNYNLALRNRG